MFGTSIHWTTFFYLLVDTGIVLITLYQLTRKAGGEQKRFLYLGILFVAYNFTGGFLPIENFPGPVIFQYIVTYGIAISVCVYMVYYLYQKYDIVVLQFNSSIRNLAFFTTGSFLVLFLIPYFLTDSLAFARCLFAIPMAIVAFILLWIFYNRISNPKNPNNFIYRRNKLSIFSMGSIALLPILTIIGDYQWLTFSVMNLAFYAITYIEIDRYLYFVENKAHMYQILMLRQNHKNLSAKLNIIYKELTPREFEVAIFILNHGNYKKIAKKLVIAESTVSKHASNIFKKFGVKNKFQFLERFTK